MQFAALRLGQPACDSKPQSRTAGLGSGAGHRLIERMKDSLHFGRRHTRAAVRHGEQDRVAAPLHAEIYGGARRGVPIRVLDQVHQDAHRLHEIEPAEAARADRR